MSEELSRVDREKAFHDSHFADPGQRQKKVARFYELNTAIADAYRSYLKSRSPGATVLEYGCGTGSYAFDIARWGAKDVIGIDISPVAIRLATERAGKEGLSGSLQFAEMNAENLRFEPESFDLIIGTGILHHLDLPEAMRQIRKVIKKDGAAVFLEPLGHNPFINLFRRLTPAIRSADEHPLTISDLKDFEEHFEEVDIKYFFLTVLMLAPVVRMRGFGVLYRTALAIDRVLFNAPFFRQQAWQVMITLSKPRR